MADNSDAKSIDSWGAGTYATMQSTLVPMAHGERVFTCPKHGGRYDDRNALCRECEMEFYEKRSVLKEQQALVQQKLQELGTTAPNATNIASDGNAGMENNMQQQPPIAMVHHADQQQQQQQQQQHSVDAGPPVETLQWSNRATSSEEKVLSSQNTQHQYQQMQQQQQVPVQVQTRPMYDLQQQQMYQPASSTANQGGAPTQMMHQQHPSAPQLQQQNPFHNQQQHQQQNHPSTSQPSPTSHSLPPRYPGMGLPPPSPMQQQQQQQQAHLQQQHHQQHMPQQQSHALPTTPLQMSQSQPPQGPSPGGTPMGAPPGSFWSSPPPPVQPNNSPAQYDALTMQIQRMQQMQDWMIWQKENENAQLKQQLEQANADLNQLRLDNVLLTEKLHQQEQRMQQELKLIKLAAMQTRQGRKSTSGNNNQDKQMIVMQQQPPPPPAANLMPSPTPSSNSWHGFEDPAFFQPDFMPASSLQSSEDNAQQQSYRRKSQSGAGINESESGNVNNSHLLQQPQLNGNEAHDESVGTGNSMGENLSDEGKDEFDSNSITWPASDANSASGRSRASKTQAQKNAYKRKVGPLTSRATELLNASPRRNNVADLGSQAVGGGVVYGSSQQSNDALEGPVSRPNHEQVQEQDQEHENASNNYSEPDWNKELRQVEGSHQISDLDEYSLAAASIPQDIGFDGGAPPPVPLEENITFGTSIPLHIQHQNKSQVPEFGASGNKGNAAVNDTSQELDYPTTPPRPVVAMSDNVVGVSNGQPRNLPPRSPGTNPAAARAILPQKPKSPKSRTGGVSFVDDNASVGHTVASSTFGEDRIKAQKQTIMDPYGDKGEYTGIILRSTGMPHGYGEMVYHEDKRTYAGEWRHGRWHGFGRASFANGDTYEGEYRFDQRHGRGIYQWHDGRVFDGMFREDKRHGKGKFIWPDGAVYEGEFRNGQREGQGQYTFSDGGKYEGSWKDGRYSGYGVCSWEDGRCYKGEWLNGMAHGKGIETFSDGTVRHDGLWREDEPII
ncbi:hypothetical protein MPSEU_000082300 [Mayamaea pseudoterrestris]|nr:hypothetical protein MPSEU_000082300 [Mayamaea pseudoterrestris]